MGNKFWLFFFFTVSLTCTVVLIFLLFPGIGFAEPDPEIIRKIITHKKESWTW